MINPSNFECHHVVDLLDDYRRHNVDAHQRVMISEHLERCDSCAEELRMREALAMHLASAIKDGMEASPAELPQGVKLAISGMKHGADEQRGHLLPWMLAGAAALLIFVAVLHTQTYNAYGPAVDLASAPAEKTTAVPEQDGAMQLYGTSEAPAVESAIMDSPRQELAPGAMADETVPPPAAIAPPPAPLAEPDETAPSAARQALFSATVQDTTGTTGPVLTRSLMTTGTVQASTAPVDLESTDTVTTSTPGP